MRNALLAQAGYTLIELLVVLLLLSLIAVALSGGMNFGVRVWEGSNGRFAQLESVARSQAILRGLFASTVPLVQVEHVAFTGDPTHVSFVAPAPSAFDSAGLVDVDLDLATEDGRATLRMKAGNGRSRSAVFAQLPEGLRLSYLDASERIPIWVDHWHDRERLPDAVRIEGTNSRVQAAWPEFVARLSVAQSSDCQFDPVSLTCSGP